MPTRRPAGTASDPLRVVIAGGGVAGLETMMTLRALAGDRVAITILAPDRDFHYRPMAVGEPFSLARARHIAMVAIAADFGARHVTATLAQVEPDEQRVVTQDGREFAYDALVIACGTQARPAFDGVLTIDDRTLGATLRELLRDLDAGHVHEIAFVAPGDAFWPLPLYELALLVARRAHDLHVPAEISIVSPESAPLTVFGSGVSDELSALLGDAGIAFHGSSAAAVKDGELTLTPSQVRMRPDRIVALPLLSGPRISGLRCDRNGFIRVTGRGEVPGLKGVYAAGDATCYPIKHGAVAAQQADVVAAAIAASAGAAPDPQPQPPVIRGALLTGAQVRYLEAELDEDGEFRSTVSDVCPWDPPTKIAARHLGPYLAHGTRYAVPVA